MPSIVNGISFVNEISSNSNVSPMTASPSECNTANARHTSVPARYHPIHERATASLLSHQSLLPAFQIPRWRVARKTPPIALYPLYIPITVVRTECILSVAGTGQHGNTFQRWRSANPHWWRQ